MRLMLWRNYIKRLIFFSVNFNLDRIDGLINDIRFQSVTGLDATIDTESLIEGGENQFEHVIPVRKIVWPVNFKRGILRPVDSKLTGWLNDWFNGMLGQKDDSGDLLKNLVTIPTVNILLLGDDGQPMMSWSI